MITLDEPKADGELILITSPAGSSRPKAVTNLGVFFDSSLEDGAEAELLALLLLAKRLIVNHADTPKAAQAKTTSGTSQGFRGLSDLTELGALVP